MEEQAPKPSPNQKRDIIRRFQDEYAEALADCRTSAEHTATEGWQKLYADHRLRLREKRCELAKQLTAHAKGMEDFGLTEDNEKAVKEIAKASAELRESAAAFEAEVIERVLEPVRRCEKVVNDYRNQAARDEREAPLQNIGIEELMRTATVSVAKPRWDAESGTVEIVGDVATSGPGDPAPIK